ncbi:hypothetical protein JCM19379_18020 [Methyloparacoccus murrellii]
MLQLLLLLVALSPVVFLVGLVKPKWILFWMKEPDRLWASSLGLVMFMATFTAYSEMRVRHKAALDAAIKQQRERGSPDRQNELQLDRLRY